MFVSLQYLQIFSVCMTIIAELNDLSTNWKAKLSKNLLKMLAIDDVQFLDEYMKREFPRHLIEISVSDEDSKLCI